MPDTKPVSQIQPSSTTPAPEASNTTLDLSKPIIPEASLESDKLALRAERFKHDTASINTFEAGKLAEEEKQALEERARRFGLPVKAEEERLKQERAKRFGLAVDDEELKRREERA